MKSNIKQLNLFLKKINWRVAGIIFISLFFLALIQLQDSILPAREIMPQFAKLTAQESRFANKVRLGLHINSFQEFSISQKKVSIDGTLWFRFPSGGESLKILESFNFHNSVLLPNGDLTFKSNPIIQLHNDDVIVSYHVIIQCKPDFNFVNYPLSSHRINLIFRNPNVSPYELEFVTEDQDFTINKGLYVKNFEILEKTVSSGYMQAEIGSNTNISISYPAVCFSIVTDSVGNRDLLSLYFPMLVLFLIALFCLLIDIADKSRLSYVASAVPILVLFRMVLDSNLPETGYNTHVDYFFNVFVLLSIIILIFQTYVIMRIQEIEKENEEKRKKPLVALELINNTVFWILLGALFIFSLLTFTR